VGLSFAVIIPSKTTSNLVPCIERILMHEPNLPAENIVIVDDGVQWSEEANDLMDGCTGIQNERIDGKFVFSRAINLGINAMREMIDETCHGDPEPRIKLGRLKVDGVVLLNDDALLESPGGFSLLAETCRQHPEIGLIGATTNLTGQPLQQPRGIGLRIVPHIAFVCVYIPKSTIDLVETIDLSDSLRRWRVMDERYCIDYGCCDRDLCETVSRQGLKVAVLDSCYVDHGSLVSSFRGDPKQPKSYRQNYALLLEKFGTLTTN